MIEQVIEWIKRIPNKIAVGFGLVWILTLVITLVARSVLFSVITIAILFITLLVRHLYKTRRMHTKIILEARDRTRRPRRLGTFLLDEERVLWEDRHHPVAVLKWWLLLVLAPIISIILTILILSPPKLLPSTNYPVTRPSTSYFYTVIFSAFPHFHIPFNIWWLILLIWIVVIAIPGWHILTWWHNWYVITDKRIIAIEGLLKTTKSSVFVQNVLYVQLVEPLSSKIVRLFGPSFNHIKLDTAAQDDPFNWLRYVTDYDRASKLIVSEVAPLSPVNSTVD